MIYLLRQCPLCHKDLIASPPYTRIVPTMEMWECPTRMDDKAWGTNHSHYMVDEQKINRLFVDDYQILDYTYNNSTFYEGNQRGFEIYRAVWVAGSSYHPAAFNYEFIVSTPIFNIKSEQHLLNKLKTILTFS